MSDFNFDLDRMKEAVESKSIEIPEHALTSFDNFDAWINETSCPICNCGKLIEYKEEDSSFEFSICDKCGEELVTTEQIKRNDALMQNKQL